MTTTLDERVTRAREFLNGARRRKVGELPPSLLIRECAELRRQLGQVLGVIEEQATAVLITAELGTVLDGLAVAAEYRRYRASLTCEACTAYPAYPDGLCDDHQADLDAAEAYEDLAGRIGGAR
jgi:hypothetical protein